MGLFSIKVGSMGNCTRKGVNQALYIIYMQTCKYHNYESSMTDHKIYMPFGQYFTFQTCS